MLDDASTIDMIIRPAPGLTMLVIGDCYPWPNPDTPERLEQFKAKLAAYADYVASDLFLSDNPEGDRSGVVISVVTLSAIPASTAMKEVKEVWTPGEPSYQILVRFAGDGQPAKRPWWKFW